MGSTTGLITPSFLSASTNGRQIKVAATATAGTLLHTAVTGTTSIDMVTIEVCNTHTATVTLTIEWGGVTSPDDLVVIDLSKNVGAQVVIDRRFINNGLAIRAFASVANVIVAYGEVRTVEL